MTCNMIVAEARPRRGWYETEITSAGSACARTRRVRAGPECLNSKVLASYTLVTDKTEQNRALPRTLLSDARIIYNETDGRL